jgi:uncharacterized protein (DUF58 family)
MQFSKWITLGFGALCLVAVAGVLRAQHLYYMAAILLTLPGVSYLLGWYALRGLNFTREMPSIAWEGEIGNVGYAVDNPSRFARFFLSIHENLPNWIVPQDTEPPLFNVAGGDVTHVSHPVRYKRRGIYRVQAFDVTAMDPLGVFAFTRHIPADGELVVYPAPRPLPHTPLAAAERYGWQEFVAVALRGGGVDPDGVRPYAPGDPLRRIHWRQTARTTKLAVIEFEEAQAVNLAIVLDTHRGSDIGSGAETTLEYGVRLAASIADQALRQGATVRFLTATDSYADAQTCTVLSEAGNPGRGQDQLYRILEALARVEAESAHSISAVMTDWAIDIAPGTSLLVITPQADAALPRTLAGLVADGVMATVVHVDPTSFSTGITADQPRVAAFYEDLKANEASLFTLKRAANGELNPEMI